MTSHENHDVNWAVYSFDVYFHAWYSIAGDIIMV